MTEKAVEKIKLHLSAIGLIAGRLEGLINDVIELIELEEASEDEQRS